MKKIVLAVAVLSVCLFSNVQAHDGSYDFGEITLTDIVNVQHDDQPDFKGVLTVSGKNTGAQAWGDFHFAITGYTDVYFATGGGFYPTMNGVVMDAGDFVIGTNVGGYSTIDLYFYDNPVVQNEFVTFSVYTDNTLSENSFFGICLNPTAVPEPATLMLLGLGGLGLLRKK